MLLNKCEIWSILIILFGTLTWEEEKLHFESSCIIFTCGVEFNIIVKSLEKEYDLSSLWLIFIVMVMASWGNWEKVAKIQCFVTRRRLTNAILPLILIERNFMWDVATSLLVKNYSFWGLSSIEISYNQMSQPFFRTRTLGFQCRGGQRYGGGRRCLFLGVTTLEVCSKLSSKEWKATFVFHIVRIQCVLCIDTLYCSYILLASIIFLCLTNNSLTWLMVSPAIFFFGS